MNQNIMLTGSSSSVERPVWDRKVQGSIPWTPTNMIAILVNIRSLHNVGSIFRTSDAAGIEKIYITGYTPTPIDQFGAIRPQIGKVALGAEKDIPWQYYRSATALIDKLKKGGFTILAVEQSKDSKPYNKIKLTKKELERTDQILEIPMYGKKESLNVSVAFGIVAYGLMTQR